MEENHAPTCPMGMWEGEMFVDLELALGRLKSLVGVDDLYQLLKAYMHESQENWIGAPDWTIPLKKHLAAIDGVRDE